MASWDLPPLTDRYRRACQSLEQGEGLESPQWPGQGSRVHTSPAHATPRSPGLSQDPGYQPRPSPAILSWGFPPRAVGRRWFHVQGAQHRASRASDAGPRVGSLHGWALPGKLAVDCEMGGWWELGPCWGGPDAAEMGQHYPRAVHRDSRGAGSPGCGSGLRSTPVSEEGWPALPLGSQGRTGRPQPW